MSAEIRQARRRVLEAFDAWRAWRQRYDNAAGPYPYGSANVNQFHH